MVDCQKSLDNLRLYNNNKHLEDLIDDKEQQNPLIRILLAQ